MTNEITSTAAPAEIDKVFAKINAAALGRHNREIARTAIEQHRHKATYEDYAKRPGAIVHPDGVIELPS